MTHVDSAEIKPSSTMHAKTVQTCQVERKLSRLSAKALKENNGKDYRQYQREPEKWEM